MRRSLAAVAIALTATVAGCGPSTRARPRTPVAAAPGAVNPVPVDDAAFAGNAYKILVSRDGDAKRRDLLAGVVQRQLLRADQRFKSGNPSAGLDALLGAFYLLRAGELSPAMLAGAGPALTAGATEVARVGNEGRALAFYTMLRSLLPPGRARDEADAHLAAIQAWSNATRSRGQMQAIGSAERIAVDRSLVDPTQATLTTASDATVAWIKAALSQGAEDRPVRTSFERDEAIEAYRALRAGGATLVALYLRHGDPQGALDAVDKANLGRILPPALRDRLERAAQDDDPAAWDDLFHLFNSAELSAQPDTGLDPTLAQAAAWGAALALFRSQPGSPHSAAPLAEQLLVYGMAEVAPVVAGSALGDHPSAQDLAWGMSLTLKAIVSEDDAGQHDAAQRAYDAAAPIVKLAESKAYVGRIRPGAGRLHYVMGALDAQSGDLARARPQIEAAVRTEPSVEAYSLLARIDRQRGAMDSALSSLDQVIAFARRTADAAAETEALLTTFEIQREQGKDADAQKALAAALGRALDARQLARTSSAQARAERLLARTLEAYGDERGARRATDRAFEASRAEPRQLAATVLDAARRALVQGDLVEGREAVRRGIDADLGDEDLVYAALWLDLLEKKLHVTGDGEAQEALDSIDPSSGWPGKLAAWARGKLTDDELLAAAQSFTQRTEATFYVAMAHEVVGDSAAAMPKLQQVAKSPAIELVEVAIARDLLMQQKKPALDLKLPANVQIP